MELTLKNVKLMESMSEETTCFSASIYIGGERAGEVRNRGTGGPHEIDWCSDKNGSEWLGLAYEEWLKDQTVPFETFEGKIELLDNTHDKLEVTIDEALNRFEDERWLKRQCKKKILFKLKDDENRDDATAWWVVKAPFSEITKHQLQKRYGDNLGEIANERFV